MTVTPVPDWHLVVPIKGGARAKSRLHPPPGVPRAALAAAIAADTVTAAAAGMPPGRLLVVTSDAASGAMAAGAGARVVPDPGKGLNAAVAAGVSALPPSTPVGVLLGDLPSLTPRDLSQALHRAAAHERTLVPDAAGTGTVLLTARAASELEPRFGAGSAAAHERYGSTRLDLDLPRLRTDVDDDSGLSAARLLGLGALTIACLALGAATVPSMQGSVHSYDDSGAGSALLDDGREVTFSAEVFGRSGLRHLRAGQRVSLDLDDTGRVATRVWIVGIGDGEPIR